MIPFFKKLLSNYSVVVFLIIAVILGFYIKSQKPTLNGDGYEYFSMLESFSNHQSFELRPTDIVSLRNKWDAQVPGYYNRIVYSTDYGYFVANNGLKYSYHFLFYSLLVYPVSLVLGLLGISVLYSFVVANYLLLLLAVACILFLKIKESQKVLLMAIIASSVIYFMLFWPHPEVFSFSVVLISLVLFDRKKLLPAVFVSALGATQNGPIMFLSFFYFGVYLYEQYKVGGVKKALKGLRYSVLLFPILCPMLFYYYYFGTFNLIVKIGAASTSFMSFLRMFELYYDPNLGLLIYEFGLVLCFTVCVGIALFYLVKLLLGKSISKERYDFLSKVGSLTLLSLIMAYASTATCNWNHGTYGPSRYAMWSILPITVYFLILFVRDFLAFGKRKLFNATVVFLLVGVLNLYAYAFEYPFNYMGLTKASKFVLNHFSAFYNPTDSIYLNRISGFPIDLDKAKNGVLVYQYAGSCKKALLYNKKESFEYLESVCGNKFKKDRCWKDRCYLSF